jgi:hypothetical protein
MIVNERRNARALSNIDPPPEKKLTNKAASPLNYTDLKGQSQRAKGYMHGSVPMGEQARGWTHEFPEASAR